MSHPPLPQDVALPDGTILQRVQEFKYLGSMMSSSAEDLRVRRGQAWSAFWGMHRLWRSKEIPLPLKLRIYEATCLSILLYGCETWSITVLMRKSIDSFATSCYRFMLGIKWSDKVTNEVVLSRVHRLPLSCTVVTRQLRCLGHNLRKGPQNMPRLYALYVPAHGRRKRGRPRLLYNKYVERITGLSGEQDLEDAARSRDGWRDLVVGWSLRDQPP